MAPNGSGGGRGKDSARGGNDGASSNKSGVSSQVISLPSGGGAISGTGGNFMTNRQTGTGTQTIAVNLPDGRNGLSPDLSLRYSTGNSHGVAGMGWSLGVASIGRSTKDGVPVYDDREDDFRMADGTELVAVERRREDGRTALRYRPTVDTSFERITRYRGDGTDHWLVEATDGTKRYYGTPDSRGTDPAVEADPNDRGRIAEWYLTAEVDSFGNRIVYRYDRDDGSSTGQRWDRLYLDRVEYVDYVPDDESGGGQGRGSESGDDNRTARDWRPGDEEDEYLVSVDFAYDERPDPFSRYNVGFERRTRKRLGRIAVRSHTDRDRTIRSYELTYCDERADVAPPANGASLLASVQVVGHGDGEIERLPPVTFGYSPFDPEDRDFSAIDGPVPRRPLSQPELELADLDGNGLPDVIEIDDQIRYWPNEGGGEFGRPRPMDASLGGLSLSDPGIQLLDADGDARIDLVMLGDGANGYYPLDLDGGWSSESFRAYDEVPSVDPADPAVRFVDLDGDGVTDAIRTGSRPTCFFQNPEEGWTETRTVDGTLDGGVELDFADQRMRLADMTGDGLTDVVLIDDGHVSYWPNLGHGEWGQRVRMRSPPNLPSDHDPGRVLVSDIDGDGTADLAYVEDGRVRLWLNRCGEGFGDPVTVDGTPSVGDTDAIRLVDIHGTGIGGLLYTGTQHDEMYFLRFVGETKPYLLTETDNGIGATTRVEYAPSTVYERRDAREDRPWITSLPTPTWVVDEVTSIDHVSGQKLTNSFRYHHGYYDGVDDEFRGFGMVERRDSTTFAEYAADDGDMGSDRQPSGEGNAARVPGSDDGEGLPSEFAPVDRERFSPPTLTKTWFHVGAVGPEHGDWRELDYGEEHWSEDPDRLERPDGTERLLTDLDRRVERDAVSALAGSKQRMEVYALDDSRREDRPYRVVEQSFGLRREGRPFEEDERPAFYPHPVGSRTSTWERGDDPKTRFEFAGDYDRYGQPQRKTTIACPREWRLDERSPTSDYLATETLTSYAYRNDEDRYQVDRVATERSYTVVLQADYALDELREEMADGDVPRRLTGFERNFYDGPAFDGLALGELGPYGAITRTERLVLTDALVSRVYGSDVPPTLQGSPTWGPAYPQAYRSAAPALAGYETDDISEVAGLSGAATGYFRATKQAAYDFQVSGVDTERGLLRARRDPLDRETSITTYDECDLNPLAVESPEGLTTTAEVDYATMTYGATTDPNGNRTALAFTPLGKVHARIDAGDPDAREGDTPEQPVTRRDYHYDRVDLGAESITPTAVHTIQRKRHRWDLVERENERRVENGGSPMTDAEIEAFFEDELADHPERFVQRRRYFDGFGNEIQVREGTEASVVADADGDPVLSPDPSVAPGPNGVAVSEPIDESPRVRVSAWERRDNKGNIVESFEPFYDTGWGYTSREMTALEHPEAFDRKTTRHYDALDREVRRVGPDGAEVRTVHGDPSPDLKEPETFTPTPWVTYHYDPVDNAARSEGIDGKSYEHRWNAPRSVHTELGDRGQTTVVRNRTADQGLGAELTEHRHRIRYDPATHEERVIDELGRTAQRAISDLTGQPLWVESQDRGTTTTVWDAAGNPIERRRSNGSKELQVVDEHGRPRRTWARDDDGGDVILRQRIVYGEEAVADRQTARDRNLLGRIHRIYDEGGVVTVDEYSFEGKPVAKRQTFLADDEVRNGPVDWTPRPGESWGDRRRALLSGRKYETSSEYDALGRPHERRLPETVDGRTMALQYEYTDAGTPSGLDLIIDPGGNKTRETYLEDVFLDADERPVLAAYGNGIVKRSAYDETTDRLRRQRVETAAGDGSYAPGGTVHQDLTMSYDAGGNVLETRERTPGAGVVGVAQQSPHGPSVSDRDVQLRAFQYDARGRLSRATGRECDTGGSTFGPRSWGDERQCGFDPAPGGNPAIARRNAPDQTAPYTETYDYDPADNLLMLGHTRHGGSGHQRWTRHFGYADNSPGDWSPAPGGGADRSNRLTHAGDDTASVGAPTHSYTDNGNLETERNATYTWDHADRLRNYTESSGGSVSVAASYAYDGSGRRVKTVVDKNDNRREVTEYVGGVFEMRRLESDRTAPDGGTTKAQNTIHVGSVARRHVGEPFDESGTFEMADRPAVEYEITDPLSLVSLVLEADGSWSNREEYTPFGETTMGGYAKKRYRYRGNERDEASDLYYAGVRYYAPWLCRWTAPDPAGMQDGTNLYAYVGNDPVNRDDPTGTQSESKQSDEFTKTVTSSFNDERSAKEKAESIANKKVRNENGYDVCRVKDVSDYFAEVSSAARVTCTNTLEPTVITGRSDKSKTDNAKPAGSPDARRPGGKSSGGGGTETSSSGGGGGGSGADATSDTKQSGSSGAGGGGGGGGGSANGESGMADSPSLELQNPLNNGYGLESETSSQESSEQQSDPWYTGLGGGMIGGSIRGLINTAARARYLEQVAENAPHPYQRARPILTARSSMRNKIRPRMWSRMTPSGAFTSWLLHNPKSPTSLWAKSIRDAPYKSTSAIAAEYGKKIGKTRGYVNATAKWGRGLSRATLVFGIGVTGYRFYSNPTSEWGRVASEEAGVWSGAIIGGEVGTIFGTAGVVLGGMALGSNPPGWLILGAGVVGGFGGGATGSYYGESIGEWLYEW
jgi:RHS repeat-associated protein